MGDLYRRRYPFIRLSIDQLVQLRTEGETYNARFGDIEARLDRRQVFEAKLTAIEDEVDQNEGFHP